MENFPTSNMKEILCKFYKGNPFYSRSAQFIKEIPNKNFKLEMFCKFFRPRNLKLNF